MLTVDFSIYDHHKSEHSLARDPIGWNSYQEPGCSLLW